MFPNAIHICLGYHGRVKLGLESNRLDAEIKYSGPFISFIVIFIPKKYAIPFFSVDNRFFSIISLMFLKSSEYLGPRYVMPLVSRGIYNIPNESRSKLYISNLSLSTIKLIGERKPYSNPG